MGSSLRNGRPYTLAFRGIGLCSEIASISCETIPGLDVLPGVSAIVSCTDIIGVGARAHMMMSGFCDVFAKWSVT